MSLPANEIVGAVSRDREIAQDLISEIIRYLTQNKSDESNTRFNEVMKDTIFHDMYYNINLCDREYIIRSLNYISRDDIFKIYGKCVRLLEIESCHPRFITYYREEALIALLSHLVLSLSIKNLIHNIIIFNNLLEERKYTFSLQENDNSILLHIKLSPFILRDHSLLFITITIFICNIIYTALGNLFLIDNIVMPDSCKLYDNILNRIFKDKIKYSKIQNPYISISREIFLQKTIWYEQDLSYINLYIVKNSGYISNSVIKDMGEKISSLFSSLIHSSYILPDLSKTAELLSVSVPTICRHLKREHTSFTEIKSLFQKKIAISLLQDKNTTVEEVAKYLGFHSSKSFRRAFINWTGIKPSEARTKLAYMR